jgi:hypothetical protein
MIKGMLKMKILTQVNMKKGLKNYLGLFTLADIISNLKSLQ